MRSCDIEIYYRNYFNKMASINLKKIVLICSHQTCQQKEKKKSENCGSPTEARKASRVTQLGVWGGAVSPPNFFDIFNCSKEFWGIW